jgi:hypothetical protein
MANPTDRKTALTISEYKGFGGPYHDSISHASMFRSYKPYNFGVKTAQLFSSSLKSELINKKFTYQTIASGNYYVLPGGVDDYEWEVVGDARIDYRITELLVATNAQPGKGNQPFRIALDKDWLHEPEILLSEDPNAPALRIIGEPEQLSAHSFAYEVELQSGDANDWIPVDLIDVDRLFCRISTAVGDELNPDYGSDEYGQMVKLRSHTGQFANKIEVTDKFIRTEIAASKNGTRVPKGMGYGFGGKTHTDAIGSGYIYQASLKDAGKNEMIEKGVFLTKAEARLLERTEMDREMMMEFGRLQTATHRVTGRPIKIAPGWRQLVRDGHFWEHNGSLTLSDLSEYLSTIFFRRKSFDDRKIYIYSGEGGIEYLSRLIAEEASNFNFPDAHLFTRPSSEPKGYHANELEFGAQFTKVQFFNGVTVCIVYDPIKDDDALFKIKAPGTNRPLESYAMDIFDFGYTDYKAEGARDENITMVMQDGVEEYFMVSNVYDLRTGAITDGSNAYSNNKEGGIYRTVAGSLCIWDVSRVGRIEYNPFM